MKILLTGFEPFADEKINPSWEAVKRIESKIKNCKIFKVKIPTVFNKAIDVLKKKMEDIDPDVVLSIGQAGGETDIRVERVAININDARISDNEGNEPVDATIFEDGKNAYFSNLPIKAVVQKIQDDGIPAHVSNSAGTFVCNNLMYGLLYLAEKKYNNIRGGFIHVPFIPSQVVDKKNKPSMNLDDIEKAIKLAIKAVLENNNDITKTGGSLH